MDLTRLVCFMYGIAIHANSISLKQAMYQCSLDQAAWKERVHETAANAFVMIPFRPRRSRRAASSIKIIANKIHSSINGDDGANAIYQPAPPNKCSKIKEEELQQESTPTISAYCWHANTHHEDSSYSNQKVHGVELLIATTRRPVESCCRCWDSSQDRRNKSIQHVIDTTSQQCLTNISMFCLNIRERKNLVN